MSQRELQEFAKNLSLRERRYLRAYLWMLDRVNDPAWKTEMSRRLRAMKAGHEISSDEYYRRVRVIDQRAARKQRKRKAA